jgi:hypothetical protein
MGSEVSELVKKVRKVGTEMNHGDWDIVRPRMLVWKVQRATMNDSCSPLWLSSGSWGTGGAEIIPRGALGKREPCKGGLGDISELLAVEQESLAISG